MVGSSSSVNAGMTRRYELFGSAMASPVLLAGSLRVISTTAGGELYEGSFSRPSKRLSVYRMNSEKRLGLGDGQFLSAL